MPSLTELPANLPHPIDDGACSHLQGLRMPSVVLPSTAARSVDLSALPTIEDALAIRYFQPRYNEI